MAGEASCCREAVEPIAGREVERTTSVSGDTLRRLQRDGYAYFPDRTNPASGLVLDSTRPNAPASIAVVGFALGSYPVAVEPGWLSRREAAARTRATLGFFRAAPQGPHPTATGHRGFYYHFLDPATGERHGRCELSTIDTALLLAGALAAAAYFDRPDMDEERIRVFAEELVARPDWNWARDGPGSAVHRAGGREIHFYDYLARGAPFGPDDGTVAPWAAVASLPFAPEEVLETMDHFHGLGLGTSCPYGFEATFNATYPVDEEEGVGVSSWNYGLNQGPLVLMIENHRTGLLWELLRDSSLLRRGLQRAGFRGGWL